MTPPSRLQPAAINRSLACLSNARSKPEPSLTGRHIGLAEHGRRKLVAERLEQLQFVGARLALRLHRGVGEEGDDPLVGRVHDVLVGPFEVEGEPDRLAHPRILELLAPGVEVPALDARGRAVVQRLLLHPPVLDGGEIVGRRPEARGVFLVVVDRAGLERLEGDLPLAIIFEAQPVEIVLPEVDRQLGAPIVRVAREFDEPALLEGLDLVRTGAERRVERRGGEVAVLPPGGGKNRHADDDEMRVAAAVLDEAHMNDIVALGLDRFDLLEQLRVDRMALVLEDVEREGDVGGGDLRAVGEPRFGPQPEAVVELVGGVAHRSGEQPVDRIRVRRRWRSSACRRSRHMPAAPLPFQL